MRLTQAVAAIGTLTASACGTGKHEAAPSATASEAPTVGTAASAVASAAPASDKPHGPWTRLVAADDVACVANADGALACVGHPESPTYPRGLVAPKGVALAVSRETVCVGPPGRAARCADFDGGAPFDTLLSSARALRLGGGLCALDNAGVECAFGRLDLRDPPVRIEGIAAPAAFDAEAGYICAIEAGLVRCASPAPIKPEGAIRRPFVVKPIAGTQGAVEVAVGGSPCARTDAGAVVCWTRADPVAKAVPSLPKSTQVVVGTGQAFVIARAHACALDEVGAVRCWGNNNDGQLGAPSERCSRVDLHVPKTGPDYRCDEPLLVEGLPPVEELAAGYAFTCARTTQGEIYCWGRGGPQRDASGLGEELRHLEF